MKIEEDITIKLIIDSEHIATVRYDGECYGLTYIKDDSTTYELRAVADYIDGKNEKEVE